jgi:hypothetical protein
LITDVAIEKINLSLVRLQQLSIAHCKKVSDRGVKSLLLEDKKRAKSSGSSTRRVRRIDASSCPSIFVTDRRFLKAVEEARSVGVVVVLEGSGRL